MGSSNEASVLAALEQAELAARERRLAASNEAEGIVAAARQRASAISARADQRVDEALDRLRRATEAEADRAIMSLEQAAAARSRAGASPSRDGGDIEEAVAIVVARVLGEASVDTDAEERG